MPNAQFPPPALTHKANDFSLCLREDWKDKTLYTIIGPVTDYIQHNIIISVDKEVQVSTLHDYADRNVNSVLGELKARRLLKRVQTYCFFYEEDTLNPRPQVERMMLSFNPVPQTPSPSQSR